METVSNIAAGVTSTVTGVTSTVSKVIWGEPTTKTGNETGGKEPVSGVQGKGTPAEPFDQGNAPQTTTLSNETGGKEPVSGLQGKGTIEEPFDQGNADNLAESTSKLNINDPTPTSHSTTPTTSTAIGGTPKPLENTEGTGATGSSAEKHAPIGSDVTPSNASSNPGVVPTSSDVGVQTQQGADKPFATPTGAEAGAVKSTKDEAEDILKKSTGLAADGGNVDASKPGAGREANRILGEKGLEKSDRGESAGLVQEGTPKPASSEATRSSPSPDRKEKMRLKEKIKDKLHLHRHKDE